MYDGVLQLFPIKNIFYDKMDLRLFHFGMETWKCQRARSFLMLLSI